MSESKIDSLVKYSEFLPPQDTKAISEKIHWMCRKKQIPLQSCEESQEEQRPLLGTISCTSNQHNQGTKKSQVDYTNVSPQENLNEGNSKPFWRHTYSQKKTTPKGLLLSKKMGHYSQTAEWKFKSPSPSLCLYLPVTHSAQTPSFMTPATHLSETCRSAP